MIKFLLSKHPDFTGGGDMVVSRLLMDMARDLDDVTAVALADSGTSGPGVVAVLPKGRGLTVGTVAQSLARRRSLIHTRFNTGSLRRYLAADASDTYVAEHSYMAEAFISSRPDARTRLRVNTHVSESDVLKTRRSPARLEARRLERDELRVARSVRAVACLDADEAHRYEASGVRNVSWLPLSLPPRPRVQVEDNGPVAVFLGDRRWAPNADAAARLLRLWPSILEKVPDARLVFVGLHGRRGSLGGPGVNDLGFVDDLGAVLASARMMAAPVSIGGGVRVKLLEAASIGLPVVATPVAIGSLRDYLPLSEAGDDAEFRDACTTLLSSRELARDRGRALTEANAEHWSSRRPHAAVADWLTC